MVDSSTLQRSKRKLEEKARIYASMKRGDYVPPTGSTTAQVRDANLLVDFDRKWAEAGGTSGFISSDEESDSANDGNDELVEYEDEFGRQRQGTRAEARREERRRAAQAHAAATLQELSARPAPPPQLIRGDVIQSAAFNPDAQIAAQMEELARRRDRSLTPPPASHYDANSEIRSKGVGFYAFSREEGERRREMEELERQRQETERKRAAQAQTEADAVAKGGSVAEGVGDADDSKIITNGHDVGTHPRPDDPSQEHHYHHHHHHDNQNHNDAESTEINSPKKQAESQPEPSSPFPTKEKTITTKDEAEEAEEIEEVALANRFLDSLDDEGIR